MAIPNFYKIDCEREVVLQGKSTFFITISRNDAPATGMNAADDLYICVYMQPYTFETHYQNLSVTGDGSPLTTLPFTPNTAPGYNKIQMGSVIKDYQSLGLPTAPAITGLNFLTTPAEIGFDQNLPAGPLVIDLGEYVQDGDNWSINAAPVDQLGAYVEGTLSTTVFNASTPNPFDGTFSPAGSGYISRNTIQRWIRIESAATNLVTKGVTFRIDYDGDKDAHLKLNFLCVQGSSETLSSIATGILNSDSTAPYGLKSGDGAGNYNSNADYQEIHLFGYTENKVRTSKDTAANSYPIYNPLYEDRISYGLLKTNPKLSGNVKITTDSSGDIWLNSFNANDELADASFKRYPISANSTYQKDVWNFFKKGTTTTGIVFDLYQEDELYLNNKSSYAKQFDSFYNYGVEQLRSKFYAEDFTFFAPLWLKKIVPDFFVVMRVNHPFDTNSYLAASKADSFTDFFDDARIVKTFDMRASSKLGAYVRKIANDSRFKEKPLDVSWENDVATYWNGFSYQNGTITSKAEFLYDYYLQDRPIKEFEEFITGGFERNGLFCTNLLNLEFLFNDEEAPLYGINRYFGFYVSENQLAEFEIEPLALGKIPFQDPPPKKGVDGEPYSTRSFVQTNANGIELPVSYYHSSTFINNTSIVPVYQGEVVGKFPLPAMVDDPLRLFYVKDRDDVFKRIIGLTEQDYGQPGTTDYLRVSQIKLFDEQEDISKYGGVNQIVSQFVAQPLGEGNSQMVLHLDDLYGNGVFQDDEEIYLKVEKYNDFGRSHDYVAQLVDTDNSTYASIIYFIDAFVARLTAPFAQPLVNGSVTVSVDDTSGFVVGQNLYMSYDPTITPGEDHGSYVIENIISGVAMDIKNVGGFGIVSPGATINPESLFAEALSGQVTYNFNPISYDVRVDNYLSLSLGNFLSYVNMDSWRIDVNYPSIIKNPLNPTAFGIDAYYAPSYPQFTWKMVANSTGLRATESWDFPIFDSETEEYVSHFSNTGTPDQVAAAITSCINSMEGLPVIAKAYGPKVYMVCTLDADEGSSALLQRKMQPNSVYGNMGFYERNFCNNLASLEVEAYSPDTSNYEFPMVSTRVTPGAESYYINVYRTFNTIIVTGRTLVNPATFATATTTGTFFNSGIINMSSGNLALPELPFLINIDKIPIETAVQQVVTMSTTSAIEQYFVGSTGKEGNRVLVKPIDGQQYYQDKKVQLQANLTQGSTIASPTLENIYVGAPVIGNGIADGTIVVEVKSTYFVLSQPATLTTSSKLNVGEISMFNHKPISQVWYQTLKGMYRKIKGWNIQGRYAYSLPSLEDPVYDDVTEKLIGFNDIEQLVIQIEDQTQQFYLSDDSRVVAYSLYRPKLGIFSIFPLREFDFDFYLSDYSYTPTIEAFRYFFDEKVNSGETVELPLFENYKLEQYDVDGLLQTQYPYYLDLEIYDATTETWYLVDEIYITQDGTSVQNTVINTFFPLYDYDVNEKPLAPMYASAGKRNFDRRTIRVVDVANGEPLEVNPTRVRIRYNTITTGDYLKVVNYNYQNDLDLSTFNGFAGLQDITTIDDADVIQGLKDQGEYINAYTYQLLLSEYDRLRENYTKDWALKSIVVPYINKWVQEGTDARDNYYRLNNSSAFGLGNMSPIDNIDFAETSVLTHEWPYLDSTPKSYPLDNLADSRSYMFARLSDIAAKNTSWYDLLKNDNTEDWFTKYFTAGLPTDYDYEGKSINKPREERYTFFNYNASQGTAFTLFRGGKLQVKLFDDTDPNNLLELTGNPEASGYKFAAVAKFEPFDFAEQNPVKFEVVRSDKYKWIAVIITVRIQDYRSQDGSLEYMFQYFMRDLISNSNQQQLKLGLPILPYPPATTPYSVELKNFLPYETSYVAGYTDDSIMRPKQGIMGGGYLRIANKRLSSIANPSPLYTTPFATIPFIPVDVDYNFNLINDISTIQTLYPVDYNPLTGPFVYNNTYVSITPQTYGVDGFFFSFHTAYLLANNFNFRNIASNQTNAVGQSSDTITLGTDLDTNIFSTQVPFSTNRHGIGSYVPSQITSSLPGAMPPLETTLLEGGNQGFEQIQNFLTFGNISTLLNTDSPFVEYLKVTDAGAVVTQNFSVKVISPDAIVKQGVLQYLVDEEKPAEFTNIEIVGYTTASTNGQEYLLRHRGAHEPKTRDVISFWVREEPSVSSHFQQDFLLSNTRINSTSSQAGMVKNYGFNKVSTSGNILAIARNSAFQSVYPLLNEVSVDHKDSFALSSSWDAGFYRNYSTSANYVSVDGISEMQEFKSFLASKAMAVPKSFELHTFTNTEVTFQLTEPALGVGVSNLVTNDSSQNASIQNSNKPKLIIELDLRSRLLRALIEDITTAVGIDEFERLQTLGIPSLSTLSNQQVEVLRTNYFEKNIINLYEVTQLMLYSKVQAGIEILNLDLSELQKAADNYTVNKDCVVTKVSDFVYRIEKTLEPNTPAGFSLSTTYKRI